MKWVACIAILSLAARAATVSVTDFGAAGDAVMCSVDTTASNATVVVTSANTFSESDIGKLVSLIGVGATTTGTNHQDLVSTITGVYGGTNITIWQAPGLTAASVRATIGTSNWQPFQNALDSLSGTNDVVNVPAGTYLLIPPYILTNGTAVATSEAAIEFRRGGFTLQGSGNTTLLGNGAWKLLGGACHRGKIIACRGAVTNNYPVVMDGLIFDGGVAAGYISNHGFPASADNGNGWDETHAAFMFIGSPTLLTNLTFSNCTFQHWRGEILQNVVPMTDSFVTVTNCVFHDGNASAFNLSTSHRITHCTFDTLYLASEWYQGYSLQPSFFEDSTMTNIGANGIVIGGADTNRVQPLYTIQRNRMASLVLNPAANVLVSSNTFLSSIVAGGAGPQGTGGVRDITIQNNVFTNTSFVFYDIAFEPYATSNVVINANTAYNVGTFVGGYGYNKSVTLRGNTMVGGTYGVDSTAINGIYFYDDGSNTMAQYLTYDAGGVAETNTVGYARGVKQIVASHFAASLLTVDDSTPSMIPLGASLLLSASQNGVPVAVKASTTNTGARTYTIPNGGWLYLRWDGSAWVPPSVSVATLNAGQVRTGL